MALVSAGIVAGVVLGAGVALLMAPQSGEHTRLAIGREFRKRRPWRRTPWERLGEEFRQAARAGRNRLRLRDGQTAL
ncbi:MAG: YtxH domain-containing protein [Gemmatimonadaceae bacterium]